jgi:hypothetical protein
LSREAAAYWMPRLKRGMTAEYVGASVFIAIEKRAGMTTECPDIAKCLTPTRQYWVMSQFETPVVNRMPTVPPTERDSTR